MASYTETFPNNGQLSVVGGDQTWQNVFGDPMTVTGGKLTSPGEFFGLAFSVARCTSAVLDGPDHAVSIVMEDLGDGTVERGWGVLARFSGATITCYSLECERFANRYRISRIENGTRTDLTPGGSGWVGLPGILTLPATLRLEVEGSQIRGYVNDTLLTTIADDVIGDGVLAGVLGIDGNNVIRADNWEAHDLQTALPRSRIHVTAAATGRAASW